MKHSEIAEGEIHRAYDKTYASLAALFAATTSAADVGKIYKVSQGNTESYYVCRSSGSPGTFMNIANGRDTLTSTTDATETTAWSLELADNTGVTVIAKVTAMETDGSDRNTYWIAGLFYRDGGTATQQGATAAVITAIESDVSWACIFDVNANDVRLRITGDAATNITWVSRIEIIHNI